MRLHKTAYRCLLGFGVAACALLSGCKGGLGGITEDYGVPPPQSHPTVVMTDFSYSPSAPVRAGDTLTLTATTNRPIADASISASARPASGKVVLRDDGQPPDAVASDGLWTAEYTWPADAEPTTEACFFIQLEFDEYYMWQTLYSEKFEILPAEE